MLVGGCCGCPPMGMLIYDGVRCGSGSGGGGGGWSVAVRTTDFAA